jgi:hypothetical protein
LFVSHVEHNESGERMNYLTASPIPLVSIGKARKGGKSISLRLVKPVEELVRWAVPFGGTRNVRKFSQFTVITEFGLHHATNFLSSLSLSKAKASRTSRASSTVAQQQLWRPQDNTFQVIDLTRQPKRSTA